MSKNKWQFVIERIERGNDLNIEIGLPLTFGFETLDQLNLLAQIKNLPLSEQPTARARMRELSFASKRWVGEHAPAMPLLKWAEWARSAGYSVPWWDHVPRPEADAVQRSIKRSDPLSEEIQGILRRHPDITANALWKELKSRAGNPSSVVVEGNEAEIKWIDGNRTVRSCDRRAAKARLNRLMLKTR